VGKLSRSIRKWPWSGITEIAESTASLLRAMTGWFSRKQRSGGRHWRSDGLSRLSPATGGKLKPMGIRNVLLHLPDFLGLAAVARPIW